MTISKTALGLTKKLINQESITPDDNQCQDIIAEHLTAMGFHITSLHRNGVRNLWAEYGHRGPLFVFCGHTDTVPAGPLRHWASPPFQATIRKDCLYGRGAADMKSSVAAMTLAFKKFIAQNTSPFYPIRIHANQ